MKKREVLQKQIEQYYASIESNRRSKITLRSWCISLITGLAIASNNENFNLSNEQALWVGLIPLILFWMLEGLNNTFFYVDWTKVEKLEKLITSKKISSLDSNLFYASSKTSFSLKTKLIYLFRSLFLTETIIGFYFLLAIGLFALLEILN